MRGDRCIDIGAVEIIDGKMTGNTFHEYINPDGKIIPPDSYMVHKISNAFLEDKPKMAAVAPRFLKFIGDSLVIAHNGLDFDFPFINHELQLVGLPQIPRSQQADSMVIARGRLYDTKLFSLDALAKYFGISLAARADAHGALVDAELLAKVYLELENIAPAREISDIVAEQHAAMLAHPKTAGDFPRRSFPASDEEIAAHSEFMSTVIGV